MAIVQANPAVRAVTIKVTVVALASAVAGSAGLINRNGLEGLAHQALFDTRTHALSVSKCSGLIIQ